jgi:hypothetical protein
VTAGSTSVAELRAELARRLGDPDPDPDRWLLGLIQWIDTAFVARVGSRDEEGERWLRAVLACGCVATGPLVAEDLAIQATVEAARRYALAPDHAREVDFMEAATSSYPFGPGDGCLGVDELGGHGAPGGGCTSGAGFLWEVASWAPTTPAAVRDALVRELSAWLGRDAGP